MPQGTLLFPLGFFIAHDIRIARIRNDIPQVPETFQVLQKAVREQVGGAPLALPEFSGGVFFIIFAETLI